MIVVLSGEGSSDLGQCTTGQGQCRHPDFAHGPMTILVDKIVEEVFHNSLLENAPQTYVYLSEKFLQQLAQERKRAGSTFSLVGKKRDQETGYFYINAWMLGEASLRHVAGDGQVIGVLFRDTDGTRTSVNGLWESKLDSMLGGFDRSGLGTRGVPMLPRPKSEAWLLCAAQAPRYANCDALERRSGNDNSPNSLKDELSAVLQGDTSASSQSAWLTANGFDQSAIAQHMPSFNMFRTRLLAALREG